MVHIFSAMERCNAYKQWQDKPSGKTFVKNDSGKCLYYYIYFLDPDFGLCYLCVEDLHQVLDILANRYCPAAKKLKLLYRWSIMQVEYVTDIVFTCYINSTE